MNVIDIDLHGRINEYWCFLVAQWVKDLTVVIAVARVAGVVRV